MTSASSAEKSRWDFGVKFFFQNRFRNNSLKKPFFARNFVKKVYESADGHLTSHCQGSSETSDRRQETGDRSLDTYMHTSFSFAAV